MTIEEKANILLQDYRLRAENDYLNILNDIYIERINKAVEYIQNNYLFYIEYHEEGNFNRVSCEQQKIELLKTLDEDTLSNMQLSLEIIGHIEYILKGGKDNE